MTVKTEAPTLRRLRRAHASGDLPVSPAIGQAVALIVALSLAPTALAALAWRTTTRLHRAFTSAPPSSFPSWVLTDILTLTVPPLLVLSVAVVAAGLVQTGGVIDWKRVSPDLSRIHPLEGIQRALDARRLLTGVRVLVAVLVVGWLAHRTLLNHGADLAHAIGDSALGVALAGAWAREVGGWVALMVLGLAVVDGLVARQLWWQGLKMTRGEILRERREAEGDPNLKAARRRAHQEALQGATLAEVRRATVVVIDGDDCAIALRYERGVDAAPRLILGGRGTLARRIIDEARVHAVPISTEATVARALIRLDEGRAIPPALYEPVAEILRVTTTQ